jgi:hypothetical protein
MDGTGNFGSHAAAADTGPDTGIETPINVGNDERRMHVRAYNYWVSLLDGRAYPSIEDLDPESLSDFGPNSVLLDFTSGLDNPSISWLGHKLREACELPADVASVNEIPSRSLLSRLTDHYMQIIANRAPIGFEAEFVNSQGVEIMYRGILMPFSSDDDTIDFIYGVINWKEAVDGPVHDALADEVTRALEAAPAPLHTPAVPAWADGPSASGFEQGDEAAFQSGEVEIPAFEPDGTESLADWLAAARNTAEEAGEANVRSRSSLYRALAQAFDFAITAEERPEEYQELLSDAGITVQPRAPMTPIVKLVFGAGYDKTRIAEFAMALNHGKRSDVARGDFQHFLEGFDGGLKSMIRTERKLRKPVIDGELVPATNGTALRDKARNMVPRGIVEDAGDSEFVVLIARRVDGQHVAVLGSVPADDKAVDKAIKQLVG